MKQLATSFSIFILLLVGQTTLAQVASDYYSPLNIGNFVKLHTVGIQPGALGWAARSTTYLIEGSDSIFGRQYFREKGVEVLDETGQVNIFRVFWLRKDSAGNVALGAMNTSSGSSEIDSATVVTVENWFPNEFLAKGYSRTFPYGNQTYQDTVLSVTETVSSSAGTFNNCMEISESHFDSTGKAVFREFQYYAYKIGMVRNVRTLPDSQAHTDELIEYSTTGVHDGAAGQMPQEFFLSQNYPNPFNPTTVIRYQLAKTGIVRLNVYDVLGRQIATLVDEVKSAGLYTAAFNAANLPSGVYFYRLHAGSFADTKKLILLK
jgi:Secretion system C-terminal sorting domain